MVNVQYLCQSHQLALPSPYSRHLTCFTKCCIERLLNSCQHFGIWQRERRLCTHATFLCILQNKITICANYKCPLDLRSERGSGERLRQLSSANCHQGCLHRENKSKYFFYQIQLQHKPIQLQIHIYIYNDGRQIFLDRSSRKIVTTNDFRGRKKRVVGVFEEGKSFCSDNSGQIVPVFCYCL